MEYTNQDHDESHGYYADEQLYHHQLQQQQDDEAGDAQYRDPFEEDFDQAFSQFTEDFALNYQGLDKDDAVDHADTAAGTATQDVTHQHVNEVPNGTSASQFASFLNEKESVALTEFLDKVSVDPEFLFDPKLAEGLLDVEFNGAQPSVDDEFNKQKTVGPHPPLAFASDPNFPPQDTNQLGHRHYHQHENQKQPAPKTSTPPPPSSASASASTSTSTPTSTPSNMAPPAAKPEKAKRRPGRRENLSEDQKRVNHITSEKKRRDLIKRQFDQMCSMVPTISEHTPSNRRSKSDILMAVHEYLVFLIEQNKYIRQQLRSHGVDESELPEDATEMPPQPKLYNS